ncbi:MAG: prephenate dehydratase [Actinomycetota bacterium]
MAITFLGPSGTFCEEALLTTEEAQGAELQPCTTIPEVIASVEEETAHAGLVPFENSIEGTVNLTLDTLAFSSSRALIRREVKLPIRLHLMAPKGSSLSDVTAVLSHPHAAGQCREWTSANLPGAEVRVTSSNAEAARIAAETGKGLAAVGPALSAKLYGLDILASGIEDYPDNVTRFLLLAREMLPPTGNDRTSVLCFAEDRPGSLLSILEEFAVRDINLTRLESRPAKTGLGEYFFSIDCEGHLADARMRDCLMSLYRKLPKVKVLGSYPSASPPRVPETWAGDAAYEDACRWHACLEHGIAPAGKDSH